MIECPNCRTTSPDDAAFCATCGRRLPAPAGGFQRGEATLAPQREEPARAMIPPARAARLGADEDTAPAPAPSVAAPTVVRLRLNSGVTFDLRGKAAYLIGRRDDARGIDPDVELTPFGGVEGGVSRAHAMIYIRPEGCLIEDLESANETLLNTSRLVPHQLYLIHDGDHLRLGRLTLVVVLS